MNKTHKIAVYGSLREGLGNHGLIRGSKLLGTFKTNPEYSLYTLGGFPGLKPNGKTAVTMEVYEVDEDTARRVDQLEGYSPNRPATFYDKVDIETPFGTAGVYTYVSNIEEDRLVQSGDWTEFVKERWGK